ncbi:ubiquinol-cytochrome C reductase hinge domain-containing protein [Cubamyces menziesii]|nr:ubiquinol-cytochrome C reductase hinge domain-containing protein [Cubamyces menziesii]
MSLSSFFSSFLPVVHADAPEEKEVKEEAAPQEEEETQEEPQEEEEEAEEPEDPLPALQEECAESAKCAPHTKHFLHCEEKVNAGEGFKGEDCIEEFMMHCVNGCVAPKLFAKLK